MAAEEHKCLHCFIVDKLEYLHCEIIIPFVLNEQCLRPPYGVVYLATKKNYVGFNGGARHLKSLVDEEGIFGAHLVKEMADRDVWKFFVK